MVRQPGRAAPGRSRPNRHAALRGSLPGQHAAAAAPRQGARGAPPSPPRGRRGPPPPGRLPALFPAVRAVPGTKVDTAEGREICQARSRLPPTAATTSLDQQRVETKGRSRFFPISAIRVAFW